MASTVSASTACRQWCARVRADGSRIRVQAYLVEELYIYIYMHNPE